MNKRAVFAILLILLGVVLILNQVTALDIKLKNWWPMILVLIAVIKLASRSISPVSGIFLALLGILLQLRVSEILITENLLFPAILILAGLWVIFSGFEGKGAFNRKKKPLMRDRLDDFVIFSGLETCINSDDFTGGSVTAVFGGAEIDLRDANLSPSGGSLDLTAVFGSVEVRVPEEWNVVVKGTPVFGGWENKAGRPAENSHGPILNIHCTAVFGGVGVSN